MFRRWFKSKNDDLLGLDITSDTIKFVDINLSQTPHKLENYSVAPVPHGALEKKEVKDARAMSNVIKQLYQNLHTESKSVAIAIPRSSVILKNTLINSRLSPSEVESRVWLEANQHFPELIGGLYLDYQILGPSKDDPNQLDLMMIACRKDQIDPFLDVLKQSDLVPTVVDVNSYALERALDLVAKDIDQLETVALINLDLALSSLIVIHQKSLIYAHDYSYDGHRLLTQTKTYTESDKKDATEYHKILKDNLIPHLLHAMHFFYSSRPNVHIQVLYLAGECVTLPDLAHVVETEIGVKTCIANPFKYMQIPSHLNAEEVTRLAPMFMLACGLAMDTRK